MLRDDTNGWLEWQGFTRSRVFHVERGLRLPLERLSFLDGDGGFGRTATYLLPLGQGVWVTRRGVVGLYAHDLSREVWRLETEGWIATPVLSGDVILDGPDRNGDVLEVYVASGRVVRRGHIGRGLLVGFTQRTLLYSVAKELGRSTFRCVDRATWEVLWERDGLGRGTSAGEKYLIDDELNTVLGCVDAPTGRVKWTFEVAPEADRVAFRAGRRQLVPIRSGFPSVVAVGKRVIVVLDDSTVCSLDLETGKLLATAKPPFPGIQLVTETSVFFLQAFGLSEFDHRAMKEVERIEYRKEVEPLYGKQHPYPCAFWLTKESVIWTTMNGVLIGVSRKVGKDGRRTVWSDRPEKALMPIGEFPLAYGDYLYRAEKGDRLGLYCYRSMKPMRWGAA